MKKKRNLICFLSTKKIITNFFEQVLSGFNSVSIALLRRNKSAFESNIYKNRFSILRYDFITC